MAMQAMNVRGSSVNELEGFSHDHSYLLPLGSSSGSSLSKLGSSAERNQWKAHISVCKYTSQLFTMADLPEKINAATFQISFADGDRIGATNMYLGSIANNIPAVYFLEEKNIEPDNDLTYWYNFGLRHNNPYILRVYAKSDYFLPGGKEMELLFTEVIECTLKDWAKKNLLLHSPNSKRLSAPFINILLDILHGLIYFRINLRRPHSWITSDNIYIVRGRAKLANVVNNEKYNIRSFTHDVQSFCSIVDELFKTNGEEIPLELLQLFESLLLATDLIKNQKLLLNSVHHPVLLSTKQRGELRHSAFSIINEFTFSYK
ncbi:hypothetical protein AAC387_Pa10g2077 [Persea americana]